jgi:hypothetical protein
LHVLHRRRAGCLGERFVVSRNEKVVGPIRLLDAKQDADDRVTVVVDEAA